MRKVFRMKNLDCANCAAKMEKAISQIKGVNAVTIGFMTQKMVLEANDAVYDAVIQEAVRVCKKIEPDCEIVQ